VPTTASKKKVPIIYQPPPNIKYMTSEDILDYTAICPICEKRTIDVSDLPEHLIKLRYKCPHCHNIVTTPLIAANNSAPAISVR